MTKDCKERIISVFLIVLVCLFTVTAYAYNGDETVYVTKTGEKYHVYTCSYLKSCIPITLEDAVEAGYTPCSRCHPPKLEGKVETKAVVIEHAVPVHPEKEPEEKPKDDKTPLLKAAGGGAAAMWGITKLKARIKRKHGYNS